MWVFSGDDQQIDVDYLVDDEFVIPSAATATVRSHTGAVLQSNVALDITTTSAILTVAGADNTLTGTNTVEQRYVHVYFTHEGKQHRRDYTYRIAAFIPLTATAQDVRDELGLDASELPDRAVDTLHAYLQLADEYGTAFTDTFSSGTVSSLRANEAVVLKAAIDVVTSLDLRAGVKFASEETSFQRKDSFDSQAMLHTLGNKLSKILDDILATDTVLVTSFVVATPTDVITGA